MFGQKCAGPKRHFDVGRVRHGSSNSKQLTIAILFMNNMTSNMNDLQISNITWLKNLKPVRTYLVRSTLDVHTSAATGQSAFQTQHKITMNHWIGICIFRAIQELRWASFPPIQSLSQLIVITLMAVIPNWLAQQINLREIEELYLVDTNKF